MSLSEQFLAEIEDFLARTGMSASFLGKHAVGDPNLVGDLRGGRKTNLDLVDRVRAFMESHREGAQQ